VVDYIRFLMNGLEGWIHRSPRTNDSVLAMPMPPNTPIPLFSAAGDTSKFLKALLTHRDTMLCKSVLAAADY